MPDVSALSLQNLWSIVRLRWRVVAFTAALLFGASVAAVLALEPRYTAQTVVLLAPATDELGDVPAEQRVLAPTDPFFIRSEVNIIGSEELSREVIRRLHLEREADFVPRDGIL